MITVQDQIECVEREIKMRKRVYPRWVSSFKMDQEKADREILTMQEVLKTLRQLDTSDLFNQKATNEQR